MPSERGDLSFPRFGPAVLGWSLSPLNLWLDKAEFCGSHCTLGRTDHLVTRTTEVRSCVAVPLASLMATAGD